MLKRFIVPVALVLVLLAAMAPWQAFPGFAQVGGMGQDCHGGPGDPMHAQLDQLTGDDFDRALLVQMSMHHAMAIAMARPAAANAFHQETKELANAIIADQAAEIGTMGTWLKTWYGFDQPMLTVMIANSNHTPMSMDGHGVIGGSPGPQQTLRLSSGRPQ